MSGVFGRDAITVCCSHSFETDDYISPWVYSGEKRSQYTSILSGCKPYEHEVRRVAIPFKRADGTTSVTYRLVQLD